MGSNDIIKHCIEKTYYRWCTEWKYIGIIYYKDLKQ